ARTRRVRVGLTGGIASGKSEVAKIFAQLGAFVIDTDELAREAVAPGSDGLAQIAREWPRAIAGGALDRAALAAIVFEHPQELARLNAIIHPIVRRLALERESAAEPGQTIVHVVPLLFETGYDRLVDRTVLVVAPEEARVERAIARDRSDEAHVRARIAAQISPASARGRADFTIENDGGLAQLRERTRAVYEALRA
ncbi:MAG TPA: dephospho-CoA kinase, partial [Verrucomicrobiae bacterium]|nr:dephospho-CoA kinase [Verrucomicrobiae bacterium]